MLSVLLPEEGDGEANCPVDDGEDGGQQGQQPGQQAAHSLVQPHKPKDMKNVFTKNMNILIFFIPGFRGSNQTSSFVSRANRHN